MKTFREIDNTRANLKQQLSNLEKEKDYKYSLYEKFLSPEYMAWLFEVASSMSLEYNEDNEKKDNEEKAQRLQDFIDEIVKSKVEPHVSELENIEPAKLVKPTKEEVIELENGNKVTKTTQYTKSHKIVNFVLEKPINGVKRVEQIRHPNNKMSSVNIYDSTNKIKQTSTFKYNYESGKLIDVTIYDKELGRRSKIKYVYNDNFTRLEKVVTIGADGRVENITKLPLSLNKRLMHSLYSIQDGFSVAGNKISHSIHRFKKMAMF